MEQKNSTIREQPQLVNPEQCSDLSIELSWLAFNMDETFHALNYTEKKNHRIIIFFTFFTRKEV